MRDNLVEAIMTALIDIGRAPATANSVSVLFSGSGLVRCQDR